MSNTVHHKNIHRSTYLRCSSAPCHIVFQGSHVATDLPLHLTSAPQDSLCTAVKHGAVKHDQQWFDGWTGIHKWIKHCIQMMISMVLRVCIKFQLCVHRWMPMIDDGGARPQPTSDTQHEVKPQRR